MNLKHEVVSPISVAAKRRADDRRAYSSEKKNIFKLTLMGMTAKKTSNQRMILMARWKRLISSLCFSKSSVGNRLVQN